MTPRQIAGWCRLAIKDKRREQAEQLSLNSIASRADGKDIKARLKELLDDGEGF